MTAFIDEHREVYGVEPICQVLPIAPSTYYLPAARKKEPALLPARLIRVGYIPPIEAEMSYYQQLSDITKVAGF